MSWNGAVATARIAPRAAQHPRVCAAPFLTNAPGRLNALLDTPRYNRLMAIAVFFMRLLEIMFFVGLVGSSIVVLISFVEDAKELFGED